MSKRISGVTLFGLCLTMVSGVLSAAPVLAADSIADITPTPTASNYFTPTATATATTTAEPSPEALPSTGSSTYFFIALAIVFIVSMGLYIALPRQK